MANEKVSSIMRTPRIRRVISLLIFLLALRLLWSWAFDDSSSYDEPIMSQSKEGDLNFKGKSCVVQGDKCVPIHEAEVHSPARGLYTHNGSFYLDGRPFRILSGSFHYFRTQPAQWGDRLLKMKAAGLNTVTTYIPWNLHETERGQYEFTGLYDIVSFIRQTQEVGLKMIIRPGPYICAEWEWGGFPHWLLKDTSLPVRSSASRYYMESVERYFSKLLPILAAYQYKKGKGPIIAFQIENEFGSYDRYDPTYLKTLFSLYEKNGIDEFLFTSDGHKGFINGTLKEAFVTVNFQHDVKKNMEALAKFQPGKPLMIGEYWSGWFDHWGEQHHEQDLDELKMKLTHILKDYGASINFYMFVGGTNFGFWNGANHGDYYAPTITSYDYDAPISECGDTTPKYYMIKELLASLNLASLDVSEVPGNTPKKSYLPVQARYYIPYYELIRYIKPEKIITKESPIPMEKLEINQGSGQGYGYILYRKTFQKTTSNISLFGRFIDRAIICVNEEKVSTLYRKERVEKIPLVKIMQSGKTLDILVENLGRVNFKRLNNQTRGIIGEIIGERDAPIKDGWEHMPFEFDDYFLKELSKTNNWKEVGKGVHVPAVYRAYLETSSEPKDTFLDMRGWGKGIVIVNGFNLGRYWDIGPQQTLYLPSPLLNRGTNEIFIFETEGVVAHEKPTLFFLDKPILQCKTCRRERIYQ